MRKLALPLYLLLLCLCSNTYAQQIPSFDDFVVGDFEPYTKMAGNSLKASTYNFYNDLRTWIPYCDSEPLKNPPIMYIEISFHVFLDNNGGNSYYTNTLEGKDRLLQVLNTVNQIYSGGWGPSDSVAGVVPLPNNDTRIRFTLGNNNERIYFYNNSTLNILGKFGSPDFTPETFYNYIQSNYPERNTKLNVYFTAGSDGSASAYGRFPIFTDYWPLLNTNQYVVVLRCHEITGNIGNGLAHELAHNLDLFHTYCGGGASPVICTDYWSLNCPTTPATCNDDEYLSDIFGTCPGTYPHLRPWVDPYDNTMPDADRITNNVMGGTPSQVYFSPMQAGQMHRTLALKSTGKYVREDCFSSIPLVINSDEEWDLNLKLYRDINIAQGAVLTLSNNFGSLYGGYVAFELPYNGTITVNSGAALVVSNVVKLSKNNKIIVKSGGTLKLESGSTTEISNNGCVEIQPGGYFCINSGTTIKLNDAHSVILLKPGYINGVNTSLLPSSTCVPSPTTYSVIGNGGIKDYANDVYIQNETITANRYITGRNIYVGNNVTNTKPQGNVLITGGAKVIFDATERVRFDAGYKCDLGSSFEVIYK